MRSRRPWRGKSSSEEAKSGRDAGRLRRDQQKSPEMTALEMADETQRSSNLLLTKKQTSGEEERKDEEMKQLASSDQFEFSERPDSDEVMTGISAIVDYQTGLLVKRNTMKQAKGWNRLSLMNSKSPCPEA